MSSWRELLRCGDVSALREAICQGEAALTLAQAAKRLACFATSLSLL
ncbi:hypothetical protein DB31_6840 [Hyalangium minutum]|uniref:Uncharacterized protein n=1 Tax=Hyalangium minutum TaxID=394096 RepID=A0A085WMM5_9BACT|nr:hypothetical protein DB31_6840 [Hyalangium minutum]